jgi:hypothetical protein
MRGGRKTTTERQLSGLQNDLSRLLARIEGLEVEDAELQGRVDALREKAAAAFVGELPEEAVASERAEVETRLATLGVELTDLRGLVEPIQRRITDAQAAVAQARIAAEKRSWLEALHSQHTTAARLGKQLAAAAAAGDELTAARRAADDRLSAWRAALEAAGEGRPSLPDLADEPEWDTGIESLRALLEGGPLRPVAANRAQLARANAEIARQRREGVSWWAKQPAWRIERDAPADVREEALRLRAAADGKKTPEKERERNIARAKAAGYGYSEGGEVLVEPRRGP